LPNHSRAVKDFSTMALFLADRQLAAISFLSTKIESEGG